MTHATPRAVACAAAALACSMAHADLFIWTGASSLDFLDPLNWDAGIAPSPDDRCLVPAASEIGSHMRIDSETHVTIDSITFQLPETELFLNAGASMTVDPTSALEPGIIVGRDGHAATLVVDGVSQPTAGVLYTTSLVLGDDAGSNGALQIDLGPQLMVEGPMIVGRHGRGALRNPFAFGTVLEAGAVDVAAGLLSTGTIDVNQMQWSIDDTFRLGIRGIATYTGGSVTMTARAFDVAVQPSSIGTALIGSGSFTVDDTARIGVLGRGEVELADHITFDIGADLVLGALRDEFDASVFGQGQLSLIESARVTVGRDFWLALLGEGELTVSASASVEITDDLRALQASDATMRLRPSAMMTEPMISIGGAADPITIFVDLAAAHDLEIGTSRTLIETAEGLDATSIALINAPRETDRRFQLQHDGDTLSLHVNSPADLNSDGVVDYADLIALIAQWGECTSEPCATDLTGDGTTDFNDLLRVLDAWTE